MDQHHLTQHQLHHLTQHLLHHLTQHQLHQAIQLQQRLHTPLNRHTHQFKRDQHKATHIQAHHHQFLAQPTCCSAVHHKWHQFHVKAFPMHQLQLLLLTGKKQSFVDFQYFNQIVSSVHQLPLRTLQPHLHTLQLPLSQAIHQHQHLQATDKMNLKES